jgi:hypothetical protein
MDYTWHKAQSQGNKMLDLAFNKTDGRNMTGSNMAILEVTYPPPRSHDKSSNLAVAKRQAKPVVALEEPSMSHRHGTQSIKTNTTRVTRMRKHRNRKLSEITWITSTKSGNYSGIISCCSPRLPMTL